MPAQRVPDPSIDEEAIRRVAAFANNLAYGEKDVKTYIQGAPHIKHAALRELYGKLVLEVYHAATEHSPSPRLLDLGAGEGSVTLPFLQLGARVTAVDISETQLTALQSKCVPYADQLETQCADSNDFVKDKSRKYDIIAGNSFLHHIPDYLTLINESLDLLTEHGQFLSFQDPLRYDTVPLITRAVTDIAYFGWRLSKGRRGDVIGGIRRRVRRKRGVYLADVREDNGEYHVTRNGVDQNAIADLFERRNFDCRIIRYFSSQNSLVQPIGMKLGLENTFAVVARRRQAAATTPA
jgi:SAM-dependent methyltransferase